MFNTLCSEHVCYIFCVVLTRNYTENIMSNFWYSAHGVPVTWYWWSKTDVQGLGWCYVHQWLKGKETR